MSILKCPPLFPKIPKNASKEDLIKIHSENKEQWTEYLKEKECVSCNELLKKIFKVYELSKELDIDVIINISDEERILLEGDNQFKNSKFYGSKKKISWQMGNYLGLRILNIKE